MKATAKTNGSNSQAARHEDDKSRANREELVARMARAVPADGTSEKLPGLFLSRASAPSELEVHSVSNPGLCVVAQGSKEIFLGPERYQYDPWHYVLITAELPIIAQVIDASPQRPYLSVRLQLDPGLVGSIMVEAGHAETRSQAEVRAVHASALDPSLLDAMLRLVRLMDAPDEAPFLTPLIMREIIYRLLTGEQAEQLRHIAVLSGQTHRIARAIERLREEYDQPLHIENIAQDLGMSVSGFHHHFKAVTAMSPLQYQKQVRLQEARRLMLGEDLDATTTALRVGYYDASHFNREYKRLFGLPPMADVQRLRAAAVG